MHASIKVIQIYKESTWRKRYHDSEETISQGTKQEFTFKYSYKRVLELLICIEVNNVYPYFLITTITNHNPLISITSKSQNLDLDVGFLRSSMLGVL